MKTLLNIKLHLSKKNIFTILVFILVLGGTTGCIQHKSDQKRLPALSFTVNGESFEIACLPILNGNMPHAVASIVKNTNTAEVMISMKLPGILKIIKKVNMETKGLHIR